MTVARLAAVLFLSLLVRSAPAAAATDPEKVLALCPGDALACMLAAESVPLADLQKRCAAKAPGACIAAAYAEGSTTPFEKVLARVVPTLVAACDARQHGACALALALGGEERLTPGWPPFWWTFGDAPSAKDKQDFVVSELPSRARIDAACEAKEPVACELLGRYLLLKTKKDPREADVEESPDRDSPAMKAACKRGNPRACFELAAAGAAPATEFAKACDAGVLEACHHLVTQFVAEPKDARTAATVKLTRERCALHHPGACALEVAYEWKVARARWAASRAPGQDAGEPVWRRPTADGSIDASFVDVHRLCPPADFAFDHTELVRTASDRCETMTAATKKEQPASFSRLAMSERYCRGLASSCLEAARAHASGGHGFPADKAEALRFAEKACAMKDLDGCELVATLGGNGDAYAAALVDYATRKDRPDELAAAVRKTPQAFRNATTLRSTLARWCPRSREACAALSAAFRDGLGGAPDPVAALEPAAKACAGNDGDACARLAAAQKDPATKEEATRQLCLARPTADCKGVSLFGVVSRVNVDVPASERDRDWTSGHVVSDGHLLVFAGSSVTAHDLATGERVAGPVRWIPAPRLTHRCGRPFGASWTVKGIHLEASPTGPIGLVLTRRQLGAEEKPVALVWRAEGLTPVVPDAGTIVTAPVAVDVAGRRAWAQIEGTRGSARALQAFSLDTGKPVSPAIPLPNSAETLTVTTDGSRLLAGLGGGRAIVVETASRATRMIELQHVWGLAMSPDGKRYLRSVYNGTDVHDLATNPPKVATRLDGVSRAVWDPSSTLLAALQGNDLLVFDAATGQPKTAALRRSSPLSWVGKHVLTGDPQSGGFALVGDGPLAPSPRPAWLKSLARLDDSPIPPMPESLDDGVLEIIVENDKKPAANIAVSMEPDLAAYADYADMQPFLARLKPWTGTTDAKGVVVRKQFPRGRWIVRARAPGLFSKASLDLAVHNEPLTLFLNESRRIGGSVVEDSDKRTPLAGARVEFVWKKPHAPLSATTGPDGTFLFDHLESDDMPIAVRATSTDGVQATASVDPNERVRLNLRLQLPPLASDKVLRLRVTGESGRPAAHLVISESYVTDADGRVAIAEGFYGLNTLRLPIAGRRDDSTDPLEEFPRVEIRGPYPKERAMKVFDASIDLRLPAGHWSMHRLDGRGNVVRSHVRERNYQWIPGGTYRFVGASRDGRTFDETVVLKPGEQRVVEAVIAPARTITGRVVDGAGRPVEGALVEIDTTQLPEDRWSSDRMPSGADGRFSMPYVGVKARGGIAGAGERGSRAFLLGPTDDVGDVVLTVPNGWFGISGGVEVKAHKGAPALFISSKRDGPWLRLVKPLLARAERSESDFGDPLVVLPIRRINGIEPSCAGPSRSEITALMEKADPAIVIVRTKDGKETTLTVPASLWREYPRR